MTILKKLIFRSKDEIVKFMNYPKSFIVIFLIAYILMKMNRGL